jgi:S1-C subfamily serine protease/pSer/pThr/pTyr-binding forkhead associated (FHA) protein
MRAVFIHITGLKRGQREIIGDPQISIGRAPSSTLAFAPTDTRASAHHAEIAFDGTGYVLRDAGSTNGTYVNGRRVYTTRLKAGDIIEFGTGGPQVQFEFEGEESAQLVTVPVAPTQALDTVTRGNGLGAQTGGKEFGRTTVRLMIDHAVKKSSTQFRVLVTTLTILVVALMSVVAYLVFKPTQVAGFDPSGIARKNQAAVVFIYVRFVLTDENGTPIDEEAATGSGFVVSPKGYIVTNRHVLQLWEYDPTWVRNRYKGVIKEIKIVFADHSPDEARPGQVVRISDSTDTDVAILHVDPFDGMPVLTNFNADVGSLSQGDPVVVIGYPLGKDLFEFTNAKTAQTSLSAGVISKVSPRKIQIDASANPGNSGGPIFDAKGRVIAVLTQGLASLNAQNINFGTPIDEAVELLPR